MAFVVTTLVSFNGANGIDPVGSLIADANGDLFGTTAGGGANNAGTVFEIAKTATGYASTPTTLVSFNGANGIDPVGSLIADANGDLFGTAGGSVPNKRRHGVRDRQDRAPPATPSTPQSWSASTAPTVAIRRLDRRRPRRPIRYNTGRRGEQRRHGVRDRQDRHRLRQHPHHPGQLQRRQRHRPGRQPDRRRQRRPVRHDSRGRREQRRHGVRDRQDRHRLRQHPHHPGQLQRHVHLYQRHRPGRQPDRRRQRRPVRHSRGRREQRRHGVRDRQEPHRLRQHATILVSFNEANVHRPGRTPEQP